MLDFIGGMPVAQVINIGLESGFFPTEVASLLAGSTVFLCPENLDRVERELDY